jgi:hypothetical protein
MPQAKCSKCQRWIFSNETIAVEHGQVFHADCRRPQALTYEERVLLYRYCWEHRVAECPNCARRLRQEELASDFLGHKTHLCPQCRTDVTHEMRMHLYACPQLPAHILKQAVAARDAAVRLVKDSEELSANTDVLKREADAALAALRETMGRSA